MHKENVESVEQRLRNIRNRLVGDDQEKVKMFSRGFLEELKLNVNSQDLAISKLSSEILLLLSLSSKKEIRTAIRNSGVVEKLKLHFNRNPRFFVIKALRVILEIDNQNTIENYSFFYALLSRENLSREIKDEVYRYFYNTHSILDNVNVRNLYKSKVGLLLLTRIINTENVNVEHLRKLLKVFKKTDLETQVIIIESLENLYQSYHSSRDERALGLLKRILKLVTKIINVENSRCLVILAKLAEGNLEVQRQIMKTGILERICNLFYETGSNTQILSLLFFCLYAVSNESEENRKFICKSNILSQTFYSFNAKTISRTYDVTFLSILYLFRSLTRSVQFLRSDLIDFPILDACINALDSIRLRDSKDNLQTLMKKRYMNTHNAIDSLLAVISNLLLEYGNYKSFFYQKKALRIVVDMIESFPYGALFLLKNFIYDSCWAIKEHFLHETDQKFFQNIFLKHTKDPRIIEQCLNLIRNLFCETDLEVIMLKYPGLLGILFDQFKKNIKENDENVLIQLIYVFVNMATDKRFRVQIIKNINLEYLMKNVKGRTVRIATVWLITNLTWKEYEDGVYNVKLLKDIGVVDWLESIQCGDPVLDEKIKTAIENIA